MHAHANASTCLCIFIDAHTSYSGRYYFVIRNAMLKQYAINFFASMVMVMVVLSVAGWRVVCLVFRKLPQFRILHFTACIICTTNSFFVSEIGILPVFQLYLSANALSAEWIVYMQNNPQLKCNVMST